MRPGAGELMLVLDARRRGGAAAVSEGAFIGIDVGGTKVATAVLENGELRDVRADPDADALGRALVDQIVDGRSSACAATDDARGRRSACRRSSSSRPGACATPSTCRCSDVPLRALLTERAGLPVYVENDASCAALAEAFRSTARSSARTS